MRILAAALGLVRDLVIGDSWPLSAAVAILVVLGALAERSGLLSPPALAVCVAGIALIGAPAVVVVEARTAARRRER